MTATPTDPSVTTERTISVGTADLRNAFTAVIVHAKKTTRDEDAALHRVRIHVDLPEPAADQDGFADGTYSNTWLRVMATNGSTTACALVEVLNDDATEGLNNHTRPTVVDLDPKDAAHILYAFRTNSAGEEGFDEKLQIKLRVSDVRVADLFIGRRITLPQQPLHAGFPDLLEASRRALAEAATPSTPGRPMLADGPSLALFREASRVYEQPLQVEPIGAERGAGWLVTCGARFVGTIAADHDSDGPSLGRRSKYRTDLLQRFGLGKPAAERELADA